MASHNSALTGAPALSQSFIPCTKVPAVKIAADTARANPFGQFIRTVASDVSAATSDGMVWAGNSDGIAVTTADGSNFMWYTRAGDVVALYRRSGRANAAWTQVATITTDLIHHDLLYNEARDLVHWVTYSGTNLSYSVVIYTYTPAGVQVGSPYTVPNSVFPRDIDSNYQRAGLKNDRLVLTYPSRQSPNVNVSLQTRGISKLVFWGIYDGSTWQFDEVKEIFIGDRVAYDSMFVGLDGDPDYVCGLCVRDVHWLEDFDILMGTQGPQDTGFNYVFNQLRFWWHNRRTDDGGIREVTLRGPWKVASNGTPTINDAPEHRFRQAMIGPDGMIWAIYFERKVLAVNSASLSYRLIRMSPGGMRLTDQRISTLTSGYFSLTHTASGRVYAIYANQGSFQTAIHALEITQANGIYTMASPSSANQLNCNNSPLSGSVGWGNAQTSGTYPVLTSPARQSRQLVIMPSQSSVRQTNTADLFIVRDANDHPNALANSTTSTMMEHFRITLPN